MGEALVKALIDALGLGVEEPLGEVLAKTLGPTLEDSLGTKLNEDHR